MWTKWNLISFKYSGEINAGKGSVMCWVGLLFQLSLEKSGVETFFSWGSFGPFQWKWNVSSPYCLYTFFCSRISFSYGNLSTRREAENLGLRIRLSNICASRDHRCWDVGPRNQGSGLICELYQCCQHVAAYPLLWVTFFMYRLVFRVDWQGTAYGNKTVNIKKILYW